MLRNKHKSGRIATQLYTSMYETTFPSSRILLRTARLEIQFSVDPDLVVSVTLPVINLVLSHPQGQGSVHLIKQRLIYCLKARSLYLLTDAV